MAKTLGKLKKAPAISCKWQLGGGRGKTEVIPAAFLSCWLDWRKYNSGGLALAGLDLGQQTGAQVLTFLSILVVTGWQKMCTQTRLISESYSVGKVPSLTPGNK